MGRVIGGHRRGVGHQILILLLSIACLGLSLSPGICAAGSARPVEFIILHTNSVAGHLFDCPT